MREFEKKSLHDHPAPIPPPTKHIIDDEGEKLGCDFSPFCDDPEKCLSSFSDHIGVGQHLPFHRLKLKPVNRLSCVVDYETAGGELKMIETGERRNVNSRGLVVTGGGGTLGRRRKERPGGQTGGEEGGGDKTLGLCYLCLEPASVQVSAGGYDVTNQRPVL